MAVGSCVNASTRNELLFHGFAWVQGQVRGLNVQVDFAYSILERHFEQPFSLPVDFGFNIEVVEAAGKVAASQDKDSSYSDTLVETARST